MATRNFVPRAAGEGYLGTDAKPWGGINVREFTTLLRNTEYALNEIVFHSTLLKKGMYLICTQAGTTSSVTPALSSVVIGDTINDGTINWLATPLSSEIADLVKEVNTELVASVEIEDSEITFKNHDGDTLTTVTVDNVANAQLSAKATGDAGGNDIQETYGSSLDGENATVKLKNNKSEVISTYTVDGVANASNATKASQDASGNVITTNYASALSADGNAVSLKSKSGSTLSTITINNVASAINDGKGCTIQPTGMVVPFAGSTAPTGWLLCDGSLISRTDYADLYSVIGTAYGEGDGSTTFALPNLIDKFIQGNATVGTVKTAGVPNIVGITWTGDEKQALPINSVSSGNTVGAFYTSKGESGLYNGTFRGYTYSSAGGQGIYDHCISFSAATGEVHSGAYSNLVYGKSETVQPPALTMKYLIKY